MSVGECDCLSHFGHCCNCKISGMIKMLGKRIDEEDSSDEPFPDLKEKILPFLGLTEGPKPPCRKRKDLIEQSGDNTPDSVKKELMLVLLKAKKQELCEDIPDVLRQLDIIKTAMNLTRKFHILMMLDGKKKMALAEQIKALMTHSQYKYAFKLVGAVTLEELKKALLIELVLKKLGKLRKPSKPSKPSGLKSLFSPDVLNQYLENEMDSRM